MNLTYWKPQAKILKINSLKHTEKTNNNWKIFAKQRQEDLTMEVRLSRLFMWKTLNTRKIKLKSFE